MTEQETKSCVGTIEMLRRLAYNVHGVMDVIDADNCDKIIQCLEGKEKTITTKTLENMYERFQNKIWHEHEDVMGNQMVEMGTAEQILSDFLLELGCWDDEN